MVDSERLKFGYVWNMDQFRRYLVNRRLLKYTEMPGKIQIDQNGALHEELYNTGRYAIVLGREAGFVLYAKDGKLLVGQRTTASESDPHGIVQTVFSDSMHQQGYYEVGSVHSHTNIGHGLYHYRFSKEDIDAFLKSDMFLFMGLVWGENIMFIFKTHNTPSSINADRYITLVEGYLDGRPRSKENLIKDFKLALVPLGIVLYTGNLRDSSLHKTPLVTEGPDYNVK